MMQDPREQQQQIVPGSAQVPPGYAAYYGPVAVAPKPSRFEVFMRTLRLLLRRLIYSLVVVLRVLKPVAGWLVAIVLLVGVIGWLSFQLWAPKSTEQPTHDVRVAAIAPAAAVESYIKGQQSFNADLMWSAYSTPFQSSQLEKGASKETLQARVDNEKLRGLKYVKYDYIGGVPIDAGGGMYYYSVELEYQGQQIKVPMIFTVDTDGKVVRVLSPLSSE